MAILGAWTNAHVSINSVDQSDHVRSATLEYTSELLDNTAMGDDTRSRVGGLKDWTLTVEFYQDFADNDLDEQLFALVGTTTTVAIRPVNTTASATNPEYTGTAILESAPPLGGAVGELAMITATFRSAGTLTRGVGA